MVRCLDPLRVRRFTGPAWLPIDVASCRPGGSAGRMGEFVAGTKLAAPSSGVTVVTVDSFCMIWVTFREEALWLQLLSMNIHNEGQVNDTRRTSA